MKKIILVLALASVSTLFGREKAAVELTTPTAGARVMANCVAPDASKELWWNNVRTILFSGGDMWWDRKGTGNAYYYVPAVQNKNTGASSLFAGSIWLGGVDESNALKVAAMTYRQNGIDFWSGPLDTTNAAADPATCSKYDQIFQLTRTEVDMFVKNGATPSSNITQWPGNGDVSMKQGKRLAPFVDVDFDGV
ncbi:MAG: hypothetical protein JNL60_14065, partial [Bacteroidia bacterium]|nr:hypothetical protein [Bacteroidia bacterium]